MAPRKPAVKPKAKPKAKAPATKKPAATSTGKSHTKEHAIYAGRAQSGRLLPGPAPRKTGGMSPAASDRGDRLESGVTATTIAARQGVSQPVASAELAARTRKATPAARAKNPNLNRVKGY